VLGLMVCLHVPQEKNYTCGQARLQRRGRRVRLHDLMGHDLSGDRGILGLNDVG